MEEIEEVCKEEPTESSDPTIRKLARQVRIKTRLEAAKKLKSALYGSSKNLKEDKSALIETIDDSNGRIFKIFVEGKELVTNIQVASDSRETERRDEEAAARDKRLQKLEEEGVAAAEKLQEIADKWDNNQLHNNPLDLHQELNGQKTRCLELMKQKDELIQGLKEELKAADERFMKDKADMLEDISMLAKRIDEQVSVMKDNYFSELTTIEEAIDKTRDQVLNERQSEWERLYQQRETSEVTNMKKKFSEAQENSEEIRQQYIQHDEKFRETKIRLENQVQALEQELQQVKVRCLINSEKLDYNYQILKKREDENIIIKSHQKKTLIKCQEEVMSLKKKLEQARSATENEMKRLDKDLCHYHSNVIDIERKADHFSNVNNRKFLDIWEMKTEEADSLLKQILAADKLIHETILGLDWQAPETKLMSKEDLPSYRSAAAAVADETAEREENLLLSSKPLHQPEHVMSEAVLKQILTLIADESGFLIEERLEQLLEPYTEGQKMLVRLETIFSAVGVQSKSDIALVKDYFFKYATCTICNKEVGDNKYRRISCELSSSEDTAAKLSLAAEFVCENGHPLCIERAFALKAFWEFVTKLHASKFREKTGGEVRLAKHRRTISRLISSQDLQAYWQQFSNVFPDHSEKIWEGIIGALERYHSILQERQKIFNTVQKMKQQNQELSILVSKYVPQSNVRKSHLSCIGDEEAFTKSE